MSFSLDIEEERKKKKTKIKTTQNVLKFIYQKVESLKREHGVVLLEG